MKETRIITVSIKNEDIDSNELISRLKKESNRTGVSFSFLVLKALKEYYSNRG